MNSDNSHLGQIFAQASSIHDREKRSAFLDQACAEDSKLRDRLVALLNAADEADGFMEGHSPGLSMIASDEFNKESANQIDRYTLLETIGEGGFGVVYLAEQMAPIRRKVALKIIKPGMDTKEVLGRFEAERQALALMEHPNIAKVLDGGATSDSRPYFVMELVRGIPITQYCNEANLTSQQRLRLFIPVCEAIQHAHQKGIIHRDIKPSNVMVALQDGEPTPKVIDFGIAKATHQELTDKTVFTRFAQVLGTPAYMSPEQADLSGLDIDTRTDVYSLGALLYELLTGTPPFDSKALLSSGLDAMRKTIREREPVKPSTRLSQTLASNPSAATSPAPSLPLPTDLDWIVMKCLEKDRNRRYETANGLTLDLQRHLNQQPILARPPSTPYLIQKAWERNQLALSATAAVAITIVLALTVSSVSWVKEKRARTSEERLRIEAEKQETVAKQNADEAQKQQRIAVRREHEARLNLYAADMNLAQVALRAKNYGRVSQLLNNHRPKDGEEDLRHWEWRYLWQQNKGDQLYSLPSFDHYVYNLDHSPDGRHLLIGLYDGRILVWDLTTNTQFKVLRSELGQIGLGQFSPDGSFAIGTGNGGQLLRWNARSFAPLPPLNLPNRFRAGSFRNLSISHTGQFVAAFASLKDQSTGKTRNRIVVWNTQSTEPIWHQRSGGSVSLHLGTLCFSSDGTKLFVGENSGEIRRFDTETGQNVMGWLANEKLGFTAIAASPDGKLLASASGFAFDKIQLWDPATGKSKGKLEGHRSWVSWLEFSADSRTLYSSSTDQSTRIWDLSTKKTRTVLEGHYDEVYCLSLDPTKARLITGSKDGTISIWDTQPKESLSHYRERPIAYDRYYVAPNGEHLFVHGEEGNILELDPVTLEDRGVLTQSGNISKLVFSPDSRRAFVSRRNEKTEVFETEVYELPNRTLLQTLGGVRAQMILAQKNQLISLTQDPPAYVFWDLDRWQIIRTVPLGDINPVRSIHSPDGNYLAFESADQKGHIHIASLIGVKTIHGFETIQAHKAPLSGLRFSLDGRFLSSSSLSGIGRLWNTMDWTQAMEIRGHARAIHEIGFSPDSRRVFTTGSLEDAVKIWDLTSHREVLTLEADGDIFRFADFLIDDRTLIASSWNTGAPKLHVWRAPSWEEIEQEESRPGTPKSVR